LLEKLKPNVVYGFSTNINRLKINHGFFPPTNFSINPLPPRPRRRPFEMLGRQVSINLRGLYVLVPEQFLARLEVNAGHGFV
jgi:hypothetical protein